MKIIILNGSYRKQGSTALILYEMCLAFKKYPDVELEFYHASDLNLKYCIGCCKCYETGTCIFNDDIEYLSEQIEKADGVIFGSPTYAGNISGQMKVIIDRGHFVMEQLLCGKHAVSVATYENYGGPETLKILNRLYSYSGAQISGSILYKSLFSCSPSMTTSLKKRIHLTAEKLYKDIKLQRTHLFQYIRHRIIFCLGIRPFAIRKGDKYAGVVRHWKQ